MVSVVFVSKVGGEEVVSRRGVVRIGFKEGVEMIIRDGRVDERVEEGVVEGGVEEGGGGRGRHCDCERES